MNFTRRAQLDEDTKKKIKDRVKQMLNGNGESPESESKEDGDGGENEGVIRLFDASDRRIRIALNFDTRKEYEIYKKEHKIEPGTRIIIEQEKQKSQKQEDIGKSNSTKKDDTDEKKPVKKQDEPDASGKNNESDSGTVGQKKEISQSHPTKTPKGPSRQIAIKDSLIDEFGAEAKDWKVHRIFQKQIGKMVLVKFPDGTEKLYKDLSEEEKSRVEKAITEGLAASKGLMNYSDVSASTYNYNKDTVLSRYDSGEDEKVVKEKEPVKPEDAGKFAAKLRDTGRSVIQKYVGATSKISRNMLESYVDSVSDVVSEGVRDGSLSGVAQSDIDEMFREDIRRMLHQDVETRGRSLGDHGIRHVCGNIKSSLSMLEKLQSGGIKITGKQKLMAVSAMASHDVGYTVGDVAVDITKGKAHKGYSKQVVDQEPERYEKVFGKEDGQKVREIIATHDDAKFDWENDPVSSSVRLADNVSLFGEEKVQDLFIRSPKATELACKLRLAAEIEPPEPKKPKREDFDSEEKFGKAQEAYKSDMEKYLSPETQKAVDFSRSLQKKVKDQLHEVVDGGAFEENDVELLHNQIEEMSEGKFSTTNDILSRFSGRLKGFEFDKDKKVMRVKMQYSPEGQMVDTLFGDEVADNQFKKFTKDMKMQPVRGKRGKSVFSDGDKPVFELDIEGFDSGDTPQTEAMKDFESKTARGCLRSAAMLVYPPPEASQKDIQKAKKVLEKSRDKFSDEEWKELMGQFDNWDSSLPYKLTRWHLLKSEKDFLESKTASERMRLVASIAMRVSKSILSSSGNQIMRKDKDLMSDTGGVSKNRQHEPKKKPPRSDCARRYRMKDLPSFDRDEDLVKE